MTNISLPVIPLRLLPYQRIEVPAPPANPATYRPIAAASPSVATFLSLHPTFLRSDFLRSIWAGFISNLGEIS